MLMRATAMSWLVSALLLVGAAAQWSCDDAGGDADADGDGDADSDADRDRDAESDTDTDCPPNVVDLIDTPCDVEGTSCGGPCTDPCSFCNIISCTDGTWRHLEAFPMPCFGCGDLQCVQPEEYCRIQRSDVVGVPDEQECIDLPEGCEAPSCECLAPTVAYDACTDLGGEVTIELLGG
jgi:hypothetical protein